METRARTERASYLFKVNEIPDAQSGNGMVFGISLEPRREDVAPLEEAVLGFGLSEGTSPEQAGEIADFLDKHLLNLSFTMFEKHRYYRP